MSKESLKTYDLYLSDFLYSVRKPVEDITTNDIRAYLYTYQQTHDVGNRTLDGRRIVIHTFLEWCRNERYISDNPANRIRAIKYEVKPREPLTGVEMELLRDACRTYREKAIIETFYSTGRRVYPHLIRHTTATDSLERGMNAVELQKILGHEKLDTTMIYAKVCQENVKHNHRRYVV